MIESAGALAAAGRVAAKVVSGCLDAIAEAIVGGLRWTVRTFFTGSLLATLAILVALVTGIQALGAAVGIDGTGLVGLLAPVLVLALVVRLLLLVVGVRR